MPTENETRLAEALAIVNAELRDAEQLLKDRQERRRRLRQELYKERFGIAPGVIVRDENRPGKLYRVSFIQHDSSDAVYKPMIGGCPQKKDGSWSTSEHNLFHWEVVTV